MALKTVLENLDDVPETLRSEYKEVDYPVGPGKTEKRFVLTLEDVDSHPNVRTLKTAYERVKKDKSDLSTKVSTLELRVEGLPDDFDAEQYSQLKAAAEGKGAKPTDEQLQEARKQGAEQAERKFKKENEELKTRAQTLQNTLHKVTMEDQLQTSLINAGIAPEFMEATKAMLLTKGNIKVVEEDGQFSVTVETNMGPTTVENYVTDWAASDAGKPFIAKAKGGNATGNNGRNKANDNPFDDQGGKRKVNFTELQRFIAADPAKAKELAKQAGWSSDRITW